MCQYKIKVQTLSPLQLGTGKADVIVDADTVFDEYGIPYFPAKRFKGLLHESALELCEIGGLACATEDRINRLFGHKGEVAALVLPNLYVPDYAGIREEWKLIQEGLEGFISSKDVLNAYSEIRYQTAIAKETGIAKDGSLHNMRLIDKDIIFEGLVEIIDEQPEDFEFLGYALVNLRYAGAKRNRGSGRIRCTIEKEG